MGEVTRADAIKKLAKLNPRMSPDKIRIYVDAMLTYQEASRNIEQCGAVTAHPRTGAPLENPYLKIRAAAGKTLAAFHVQTGDL
jgi:hypothetical protein